MKIRDAYPGDVLRDAQGRKWLVSWRSARCIYDPNNLRGDGDDVGEPMLLDSVDRFGPFTRLVPEREGE